MRKILFLLVVTSSISAKAQTDPNIDKDTLTYSYDFVTGKGYFYNVNTRPGIKKVSVKYYDYVRVKITNLNTIVYSSNISESNINIEPQDSLLQNQASPNSSLASVTTTSSSTVSGIKAPLSVTTAQLSVHDSIKKSHNNILNIYTVYRELQGLCLIQKMTIAELQRESKKLIDCLLFSCSTSNGSYLNNTVCGLNLLLQSHKNAHDAYSNYKLTTTTTLTGQQSQNDSNINSNIKLLDSLHVEAGKVLIKLFLLYQRIQSLKPAVYHQFQAQGDLIAFNLDFYKKTTFDKSQFIQRPIYHPNPDTIYVPVRGGWKINISGGIGLSGAFAKYNDFTISNAASNNIIQGGNVNVVTPALYSFIHAQRRTAGDFSYGLTFGIGFNLSSTLTPQFCLGPSLFLGKSRRLIITTGINVAQNTRLKTGYSVNQSLGTTSSPTSLTVADITEQSYMFGLFVGLSWNFAGFSAENILKVTH